MRFMKDGEEANSICVGKRTRARTVWSPKQTSVFISNN